MTDLANKFAQVMSCAEGQDKRDIIKHFVKNGHLKIEALDNESNPLFFSDGSFIALNAKTHEAVVVTSEDRSDFMKQLISQLTSGQIDHLISSIDSNSEIIKVLKILKEHHAS